MKYPQILLAGLLVLAPEFSALASSQAVAGCEAKRLNIEEQIDYARTHGNGHRVAGLNKALSELSANCTNEGLQAERKSHVLEKERKVESRRQELSEAETNGRADKIREKQRKLNEAQADLNEAKIMLNK